jgi:hypothetical protein
MGDNPQQGDSGAVEARKTYQSPRLVEYGRVADLLAGGMGSDPEPGKGVPPMKNDRPA